MISKSHGSQDDMSSPTNYTPIHTLQVRALNPAMITGNWSTPEILNITDIPPPPTITLELSEAMESSTMNEDEDELALRIVVEVTWELPLTLILPRVTKRQTVRESEMPVTGYTIAMGLEAIEDPFGEIPVDSLQREVLVSPQWFEFSGGMVINSSENCTYLIIIPGWTSNSRESGQRDSCQPYSK